MGSFSARRGPRTGAVLWRMETAPGLLRILPDGVMDLMWSEGRFQFAGADTTAMVLSSDGAAVTWGLRLEPGVAHALLGIPARELADQRFDLSDLVVLPSSLTDTAHADPTAALEHVFATLWQRAAPPASALQLAGSLDAAARVGLEVRDIADRHGLSERTLRRVGHAYFGYGPRRRSPPFTASSTRSNSPVPVCGSVRHPRRPVTRTSPT